MNPKKNYQGLIWTDHVISRLHARKIPQDWAVKTYRFPDEKRSNTTDKTIELIKNIEGHKVSLVVKKNDKNEWVILSSWISPPIKGGIDDPRTGSNSSFLTKILSSLFNALFGKKQK